MRLLQLESLRLDPGQWVTFFLRTCERPLKNLDLWKVSRRAMVDAGQGTACWIAMGSPGDPADCSNSEQFRVRGLEPENRPGA
jgi:hypothetical protein